MAGLDKLTKAFEENKGPAKDKEAKTSRDAMLKQSLAIVNAVNKLKARGIAVTKKAELDYLIALQYLEKANVEIPAVEVEKEPPGAEQEQVMKRSRESHPAEFEAAMEFSKQIVAEVDELLRQEKPVPVKKMEAYELGKKFLKKYT